MSWEQYINLKQIWILWQGERRIRGTALYPKASLLNHECLPNVARVDNFDEADVNAPENTAVRDMSMKCSLTPFFRMSL